MTVRDPLLSDNERNVFFLKDGDPGIYLRKPISPKFLALGCLIGVFLKRISLLKRQRAAKSPYS